MVSQRQKVKAAIKLTIDLNYSKDYIQGMLDMACYLGKITFDEKKEYEVMADIPDSNIER